MTRTLYSHLAAVRKIRERHDADVAQRKADAEHVCTSITVTVDQFKDRVHKDACRWTMVGEDGKPHLSGGRQCKSLECCDTSEFRKERATLLAAIAALLKEREP